MGYRSTQACKCPQISPGTIFTNISAITLPLYSYKYFLSLPVVLTFKMYILWTKIQILDRCVTNCRRRHCHRTKTNIIYEPGHKKMCLMSYVNNKGTDQPAHPRSLISAFVVRCLDSIISLASIVKISRLKLASEADQAGLNLNWSHIPEDTFSHDEAHIL